MGCGNGNRPHLPVWPARRLTPLYSSSLFHTVIIGLLPWIPPPYIQAALRTRFGHPNHEGDVGVHDKPFENIYAERNDLIPVGFRLPGGVRLRLFFGTVLRNIVFSQSRLAKVTLVTAGLLEQCFNPSTATRTMAQYHAGAAAARRSPGMLLLLSAVHSWLSRCGSNGPNAWRAQEGYGH